MKDSRDCGRSPARVTEDGHGAVRRDRLTPSRTLNIIDLQGRHRSGSVTGGRQAGARLALKVLGFLG